MRHKLLFTLAALLFSGSSLACPSGTLTIDGVTFGPDDLAGLLKAEIFTKAADKVTIDRALYCVSKDEKKIKVRKVFVTVANEEYIIPASVSPDCYNLRSAQRTDRVEIAEGVTRYGGCSSDE